MARYYFHIRNDISVDDEEGQDFPDFDAVRAKAEYYARELSVVSILEHGRLNLGHYISVTDDRGEEVLIVTFGDVVTVQS